MIYTSYLQVIKDINYKEEFDNMNLYDHENYVGVPTIKKIKKVWLEHVNEKYENTKKSKSRLGKFLKKYPLKFKEFCVLLDLIEENKEKTDFEIMNRITESSDMFKKHQVRYESSQLKRFNLVYKIVDPLRPMRAVYEVSYKAQLALKNKKYTDEYHQLDMVFEEDSKRNTIDALDSLYYAINPKVDFKDLIVSNELKEDLKSAVSREAKKEQIFKKWGFGKVIEYGRGTTLNFRGPPGTGKTLAANCLAKELNRKLLMVRYDQLQSCYIGVTEKNIQRVFKIAKKRNAVLFFDEADAVALSRSYLQLSWEISEVNTLLKELERFDGICIFATNFAEKYDPAFERRLTMHIDFKLPDINQRLEILTKLIPKKSRCKYLSLKGLKLDGFSGGDLKNVALNAAGIAAKNDSDKITREHIEEAIQIIRSGKCFDKNKDTNYIS